MSTTRELIAELRRRLGEDEPLPPPAPALPIPPPPKRVFRAVKAQSNYLREAAEHTTALVGIGRVGTRYATEVTLQFQSELAVAQNAVASLLPEGWREAEGFLPLDTRVRDHEEYLLRPDLGRRLDERSLLLLEEHAERNVDVQPILADGLSAQACVQSGSSVLNSLTAECARLGLTVGTPMCARFARVWLQDEIGQAVGAKVAIIILGERPGLGTGDGLSAYLVHSPAIGNTDGDRNMISNIHSRGLLPDRAGVRLAALAKAMLEQGLSGVKLKLPVAATEVDSSAIHSRPALVELVP